MVAHWHNGVIALCFSMIFTLILNTRQFFNHSNLAGCLIAFSEVWKKYRTHIYYCFTRTLQLLVGSAEVIFSLASVLCHETSHHCLTDFARILVTVFAFYWVCVCSYCSPRTWVTRHIWKQEQAFALDLKAIIQSISCFKVLLSFICFCTCSMTECLALVSGHMLQVLSGIIFIL